jgi:hypothetical protein
MVENTRLQTLIKKYAKRLLTKLEEHGILNPVVRKIVLDEVNNLARELTTNLSNEKKESNEV